MPILETPSDGGKFTEKPLTILESKIIMNYLDEKYKNVAKCGPLLDQDPGKRAAQEMIMYRGDQVTTALYVVLMARAQMPLG